MIKCISSEKIPIKMWLDDIEYEALTQANNLANLPFAFKHIALMPDSHYGYGMPIGGVLATKGVIVPNAVGVDIGCGMCAIKTSLIEITQEQIKVLFGGSKDFKGGLRTIIPVGMNRHSDKQDESLMPDKNVLMDVDMSIVGAEYQSALKQIGTLGSGNHFIEIQKGSDGHIWIMIHSGSRNFGLKIAKHYNEIAKHLNERWHSGVPSNWDLAFLPLDSTEGQAYLVEMKYAVDFALANRRLMMDRICEELKKLFPSIKFDPMINIAHNYAKMENHFGENVMVHRKGATLATEDTIGIIPGSQGSKSYIVQGLGNPESFKSCSHGAGRKMSRTKAKENLNLADEIKKMNDKGIVHGIRNKNDLDEAAGAYKDISVVMNNQSDLVKILVELEPLGVIKG